MRKFMNISIGMSLLFAFTACNDSSSILSPISELDHIYVEKAGALSNPGAEFTAGLKLQPVGGATRWQLQAGLTSTSSGQYSASGTFEFPVLGGVILIPVLGVMQIEQNSSAGFDIDLQVQGQQQGVGQVQLSFQGSGTQDSETGVITAGGAVTGEYALPELQGELNGAAQIIIPDTAI